MTIRILLILGCCDDCEISDHEAILTDRLNTALSLYKEMTSTKIVLSGSLYEMKFMCDYLRSQGIKEFISKECPNTENYINLANFIIMLNARSVYVVTSSFNIGKVRRVFDQTKLDQVSYFGVGHNSNIEEMWMIKHLRMGIQRRALTC